MRTPSPGMDVTRRDTPERSNLSQDVTSDVTETSESVDKDADTGVSSRRPKRQAESPATTPTCRKSTRTSRHDGDAGSVTRMLRMQTLAQQRHLMEVVRSGDARELKRFLEQKEGKLDVNFFDKDGQTALHHSCSDGNFELVKLLVKFGADTKLANRDGWNPLHIATFSGHHDIMLYLIGGR